MLLSHPIPPFVLLHPFGLCLPYNPWYTQPIFTLDPSLSRFPQPLLPNLSELPRILGDSLPIALVTFAVSASLASIYADKYSYTVDSNQVCFRLRSPTSLRR